MFTIFSYKITEKQLLIAILLLAAFLRFWVLGSTEFFHDEGFKAFRSIGYLDYLQNDDQTTPIQWFNPAPFKECEEIFDRYLAEGGNYGNGNSNCSSELFNKYRSLKGAGFKDGALPSWTSLSFHDHPPLFFLIQNLFFKIFGISLFAARLPSAIAGVLSVYLIYLISKKTFKNTLMALLPPLLLSVNLLHLWVSRASLMESTQIFFILLNIYYFFQFSEDRRRWKSFGFTLGLCFLIKYTSAFLIPVYGIYLLIFKRDIYRWKEFYFALGLATVIFSPVLIFNFYLWRTVGHFDLQFAYLFRQPTPEWRASLGKIQDPFSEIISNLTLTYSIPFILLTLAGIGWAIYEIFNSYRTNRTYMTYLIFWLLNIIFITLMLVAVGSGFRFIVLYSAPAIMLITFLADYLLSRFSRKDFLLISVAVFAVYELWFASDIFRTFPDFGVVKLDNYLNAELGDKRSLSIPSSSNPHLNKIIKSWALKIPAGDKSQIIVYDGNVGLSPRLWLFARRNYYLGIPTFNVDQFKNFLQKGGAEEFRGYDIYFVRAHKGTILNPLFQNASAEELEAFLIRQLNLSPLKLIKGYNGSLMFTVYKFKL